MSLSEAFHRAGVYRVAIVNGGIYRVRDSAIDFPVDDERGTRTEHPFRTVVVLSNQSQCDDPDQEEVLIAPMSHDVSLKNASDVIIAANQRNGLNSDARVILGHAQPVPKKALEKQFGQFPDGEWNVIIAQLVSNCDRA